MERRFPTFFFSIVTYAIASTVLFGDPFGPVYAVDIWMRRLSFQYWLGPLLIGLALGALASIIILRSVWRPLATPVFILTSMATSVALAVVQVDYVRQLEIAKFNPDRIFDHSLWRSLHERPQEIQFYLHAGAMKNCAPYAWSYRTMSFYELERGNAYGRLPRDWLEECNIVRRRPVEPGP